MNRNGSAHRAPVLHSLASVDRNARRGQPAVGFEPCVPAGGITSADELFASLDGQLLTTDDAYWRVQVCGIHSSGAQHWVQLSLCGPVWCGLTLRADSFDASDILDQVAAWLQTPSLVDELSCVAGTLTD
jgi:hypothetical protein